MFGDRDKSVLVESGVDNYYMSLWDYVHLNLARAGLVKIKEGGSLLNYRWSRVAGGYARMPQQRPKWLAAKEAFSFLGYADTLKGRREMVEHVDWRAREEGKTRGRVFLVQFKLALFFWHKNDVVLDSSDCLLAWILFEGKFTQLR